MVVQGSLLTLFVSVLSLLGLVVDSLVDVGKGGLSKVDLILEAGELGLAVGVGSLGDVEGDGNEVSSLLVGLDSLVLSEPLEVEGVLDL